MVGSSVYSLSSVSVFAPIFLLDVACCLALQRTVCVPVGELDTYVHQTYSSGNLSTYGVPDL